MRRHLQAITPALTLLLIGILMSGLLPTTPAYAIGSALTVKTSAGDKTIDDNACSLREALQALVAPSNDDCGTPSSPLTITFDAPGTIKLTQGDTLPFITQIVTITGPVIIDGSNGKPANDPAYTESNILVVASSGTLNLANLTLTKGKRAITVNGGTLNVAGVSFLSNSQDGAGGGAIYSSGTVNIAGSVFTANSAPQGDGGAIIAAGSDQMNIAGSIFNGNSAKLSGGAIYATTNINLTDTIFNGNSANGDDSDSDSWDEGGGALFFRVNNNQDSVTITRSVFNGNLSSKGSGGGLYLGIDAKVTMTDSAMNGNLAGTPGNDRSGGAIFSAAILNVTTSTFLNNAVVGDGGAIANDRSGTLNISNSTLVANAATIRGGGIATNNSQQGSNIRPLTTALNVTLALNTALDSGGGLYSQSPNSSYPQVTRLGNTIISGSDGPGLGGNCGGGTYTSLGHNLDSGTSCGLTGTGDLQSADPKLDAPFFNGGPIATLLTMKLKPGSAAIDAGDAAICANAPVNGEDQRGAARTQDGDGVPPAGCDIGAYEGDAVFPGFGSTPVDPGPIPFGNATLGVSLPGSLSVFNTGDAPLTISAGSLDGGHKGDYALNTAFPISIAPGAPAQTINLTCTPSATGPRSASLVLNTNAPGAASVGFTLSCTGTPVPTAGFGAVPPAPGPIDLGKVQISTSKDTTFTVNEVGTATLNVTAISIGGLHPGDFSLSSSANFSIADGAAAVVRNITCAPTALGQRSATLTMQTNDPDRPSVSFALSCTGAPAPQLVFEQNGTPATTVSGPYGVTLDPQGQHVYVTNDGAGSVIRYLRNASGYPTSGAGFPDGGSGGDYLAGSMHSLVSPDGKFVYTTSTVDDAISTFARDAEDGTLTYLESVRFGERTSDFCFGNPPVCNTVDGLNGAYGMALSPDGQYMYVSGINSNSISVLRRNPTTGSLKYLSPLLSVIRPNLLQEYTDATNLLLAYGIAISPDGKQLYATGYGSDTLVVFKRDPGNGTIDTDPADITVYKSSDPGLGGLNGVFRVTLSPDGNFVYTSSWEGNAVMAFQRNPATGQLSLVDTYSDGVAGHRMTSVAVSPDGKYLFASEFNAGSLQIYLRDPASGDLDILQTITTPDLAGARDVAVAPDGRMIFVTGHSANKVVGFAIANPVPLLTSLEPASATAGSPQISLTIRGEGFAPGAVATWGGVDLAGTQFIGPTELSVALPADKLAAAGSVQVGVRNPAPAGGNSTNTLPFKITAPAVGNTPAENPVPAISALLPNSALAGAPGQLVTVSGSGFIPDSKVLWNGAARPTIYIDTTTLQVMLSAADLAQPGTSGVAVQNPAPGGGVSNLVGFDVAAPGENPIPAIGSISPKSAVAGTVSSELLVTISGANFMPTSQARWQGTPRPTTYVSPSEIKVAISGGDLLQVGVYTIDVVNPGPGGGPSNQATFRVGDAASNPVPSLLQVSPTFTPGGLQVTLTGAGFVSGATVRWGGKEYTPDSVQPTTMVFSVPETAARTSSVLVVNPAPGGGKSDTLLVTITRLALPLVRR